MTANKLMIEADKFMGDVEEFNADTLEALVSFPAVTAGDMLMGGVVIGDQLCPCDQKVAPLRPSSSGLSFETKKTNEAKHMPVANNVSSPSSSSPVAASVERGRSRQRRSWVRLPS